MPLQQCGSFSEQRDRFVFDSLGLVEDARDQPVQRPLRPEREQQIEGRHANGGDILAAQALGDRGGRAVALLSYEAYRPMAEKGLADLARRLRKRYPSVVGVCMVHRLGEVPLAEASVAIAVSTPHRGQA